MKLPTSRKHHRERSYTGLLVLEFFGLLALFGMVMCALLGMAKVSLLMALLQLLTIG